MRCGEAGGDFGTAAMCVHQSSIISIAVVDQCRSRSRVDSIVVDGIVMEKVCGVGMRVYKQSTVAIRAKDSSNAGNSRQWVCVRQHYAVGSCQGRARLVSWTLEVRGRVDLHVVS